MERAFSKSLLTMSTAILIVAVFSAFQGNKIVQEVNFTGTWLLNKTKSEFNNLPAIVASQKVIVEQKKDKLKVQSINGEAPNDYAYTFDNKPSETIHPNGRKSTSSVQWSEDKQSLYRNLSVSTVGDQSKEEYKRAEVWTLTEDGKVLVISQVVTPSNGKPGYSFKAVYDKQ